ncbi:uncharacterized protein LOC132054256 [Lycium ferocissimum]|uniref:uncharacterized protein LOC132054256 n=1 Tax=Lycium ferocissimum TaxID=112874 RepID=UPI002814A5B4|nr:uncharacterized protein LOC132054256 [Lycium ferocissimum]
MEYVSSVSYSLVLNGGLTDPFQGKRGIRQGDPMSLYLFVIAMEYVQRELVTLQKHKEFKYHPRCKKMEVVHICFADDLLMFCKTDVKSIQMLQGAFQRFSAASGLEANRDKSSIYMSGTYWAQIFVLPKRILKMIESICRTYLWTGSVAASRKSLISWAKMCMPKAVGGQNISNLEQWNHAAILKQLWAISSKKDCLWIKRITEYYMKGETVDSCVIPINATRVIRKNLKLGNTWYSTQLGQGTVSGDQEAMVSHGRFSIKRMYLHLMPQYQKVNWKSLALQQNIHPRHKFIIWLAAWGRLTTVDRLLKIGIHVPMELLIWLGFTRSIGTWQEELQGVSHWTIQQQQVVQGDSHSYTYHREQAAEVEDNPGLFELYAITAADGENIRIEVRDMTSDREKHP